MADTGDEVRSVTKAEISAGVKATAGHHVTFIVDGLKGTPTPGGGTGGGGTGGTGTGGTGTGPGEPGGTGTGGTGGGEPGGTGGTGPGDNPQAPDNPQETPGDEPEAPKDDHGPDGPVPTPDEPVKPKPAEPEAPLPGQLDLQVVSVSGAPQSNLEVELTLPDGSKRAGHTGSDGHFLLDQLPPSGECKLEVPDVPAAKGDTPAPAAGRVRYQPGVALAIGSKPVVELPPRVRRGKMSGIHFETNKTFLLPTAMPGIRQLRSMYESFGALNVLVTGHTDTVSDAAYNRGLSEERAKSIAAFITDDVDTWTKNYAAQPHSAAWGVREDQMMLATLPQGGTPFYGGTIDGGAGPQTQGAYKKFQESKGLPQSGTGDKATRKALITDYMALDGTTLPKGNAPLTHGCGLTHLAEKTGPGVANQANRRVEMFLFEGPVTPAPQTPCPSGGCKEFDQWVSQSGVTVDLDKPPGSIAVTVTDDKGQKLDGVELHASGPTPADQSSKDGAATFAELVPGSYKIIGDLIGFEAADATVEVASGASASVSLKLKERPPMSIESFTVTASTAQEA